MSLCVYLVCIYFLCFDIYSNKQKYFHSQQCWCCWFDRKWTNSRPQIWRLSNIMWLEKNANSWDLNLPRQRFASFGRSVSMLKLFSVVTNVRKNVQWWCLRCVKMLISKLNSLRWCCYLHLIRVWCMFWVRWLRHHTLTDTKRRSNRLCMLVFFFSLSTPIYLYIMYICFFIYSSLFSHLHKSIIQFSVLSASVYGFFFGCALNGWWWKSFSEFLLSLCLSSASNCSLYTHLYITHPHEDICTMCINRNDAKDIKACSWATLFDYKVNIEWNETSNGVLSPMVHLRCNFGSIRHKFTVCITVYFFDLNNERPVWAQRQHRNNKNLNAMYRAWGMKCYVVLFYVPKRSKWLRKTKPKKISTIRWKTPFTYS